MENMLFYIIPLIIILLVIAITLRISYEKRFFPGLILLAFSFLSSILLVGVPSDAVRDGLFSILMLFIGSFITVGIAFSRDEK